MPSRFTPRRMKGKTVGGRPHRRCCPTRRRQRRGAARRGRRPASPRRRSRRRRPTSPPAGAVRRRERTGHDVGRPHRAQPVGGLGLARDRGDPVPAPGEDGHRHAADAAGGPVTRTGPAPGVRPCSSRATTLRAAVKPAVPRSSPGARSARRGAGPPGRQARGRTRRSRQRGRALPRRSPPLLRRRPRDDRRPGLRGGDRPGRATGAGRRASTAPIGAGSCDAGVPGHRPSGAG
jgi:hypothetical protein